MLAKMTMTCQIDERRVLGEVDVEFWKLEILCAWNLEILQNLGWVRALAG